MARRTSTVATAPPAILALVMVGVTNFAGWQWCQGPGSAALCQEPSVAPYASSSGVSELWRAGRALLIPLASLEDVQNDEDGGGLIPRESDSPATDAQAIFRGLLASELEYVALTGFRKPEDGGDNTCAGRLIETAEVPLGPGVHSMRR